MAKPWVEAVLRDHGVRELFDSLLLSSELQRPKPHPKGYVRSMDGAEGEVVMVSDEFNEDLLMAQCLGMRTVWVEHDAEDPYRQPDFVIDGLDGLPAVLERVRDED